MLAIYFFLYLLQLPVCSSLVNIKQMQKYQQYKNEIFQRSIIQLFVLFCCYLLLYSENVVIFIYVLLFIHQLLFNIQLIKVLNIGYNIEFSYSQMNRFASLQMSDDEEEQQTVTVAGQPKPTKKTHQQRKQAKQAKIKQAEEVVQTEQNLPERVKQDPRKKRYHEVVPPKQVPATGHYLDRRSGTGRVDKPRKEGGGRGGIGNLQDELNKDKYIQQGEQGNQQGGETAVEQTEPEKPEGITLDEYYKSKGIDFDNVTGVQRRQPVKKGEVNAEWIKKEKLTVLQTKQDKKASEQQNASKKQRRQYNDKVGLSEDLNSQIFGFNAQQPKRPEREQNREPRQQRQPRQPRQPRQQRQPREPRAEGQQRQPRQPREPRPEGQQRQPRQPREQREPREPRPEGEQRQPRQNRGPRQNRDNNRGQKGGQRGGNDNRDNRDNNRGPKGGNKKPQEKVVLNLDDFPAL